MSKDSKFLEPEYREPSIGARRNRGEIEWACEGKPRAVLAFDRYRSVQESTDKVQAALGATGFDRYIGQLMSVEKINIVSEVMSASKDEFRWYRRKNYPVLCI
ncbi:MAG: hypothetical protein K2K41_09335 [Ruminiclostridium sp.]|nr:hypothetical protein [Ruminiclostridium sp.]